MTKTWIRCRLRPKDRRAILFGAEGGVPRKSGKLVLKFVIPAPPVTAGTRYLRCFGLRIPVIKASKNNFVSEVSILGLNGGTTSVFRDSKPLMKPEKKEYSFDPPHDLSGFKINAVQLVLISKNPEKLELGPVMVAIGYT